MVVKFETQSRKRPKLNRFMDIMDFQIILLTGFILPYGIWWFSGIGFDKTFVFVLAYIIWMMKFKIGKPDGYWGHWLKYRLRGKQWSMWGDQYPKPIYRNLK